MNLTVCSGNSHAGLSVVAITESIITLIKAICNNAKRRVRVDHEYSDVFHKMLVLPGFVLKSFLAFEYYQSIVSRTSNWLPSEFLYADDLATVAQPLEEIKNRISAWKLLGTEVS